MARCSTRWTMVRSGAFLGAPAGGRHQSSRDVDDRRAQSRHSRKRLRISSDIIELTQTQYSLLPGRLRDCSGKQLVCPILSGVVEATARELWPAESRVLQVSRRGRLRQLGAAPAEPVGGQCLSFARRRRDQSQPGARGDPVAGDRRELHQSCLRHRPSPNYFTHRSSNCWQRTSAWNWRRQHRASLPLAVARFPLDAAYLGPRLRSPGSDPLCQPLNPMSRPPRRQDPLRCLSR